MGCDIRSKPVFDDGRNRTKGNLYYVCCLIVSVWHMYILSLYITNNIKKRNLWQRWGMSRSEEAAVLGHMVFGRHCVKICHVFKNKVCFEIKENGVQDCKFLWLMLSAKWTRKTSQVGRFWNSGHVSITSWSLQRSLQHNNLHCNIHSMT